MLAAKIWVEIESLGQLGDGRGRHQGLDILVPGALPGERWLVELERGRGKFVRARPLEGKDLAVRAAPVCGHFGVCGGCALQHMPDGLADDLKRRRILEACRFRGIALPTILPTMLPTIKSPLGSRRRVRLAFDGRGGLGFRLRGQKRIVNLKECPISDPMIVGALPALRQFSRMLRAGGEIVVSCADNGLDILLMSPVRPDLEAMAWAGEQDWCRLSYRSDERGFAETLIAHRAPVISFGGCDVGLPAGGFLQASADGERALSAFAVRALGGLGEIGDFFSGLGTFAGALVDAGHAVSAFDSDQASIKALAASGICARAEVRDLFVDPPGKKMLGRFDGVVLDPPRAGAAALCAAIAGSSLCHVVYASCEPKSFARDAAILLDGGFELVALQPVDQFRYSAEIELIARFKRG